MERLLAWYRVSSSVGAVVALVVANAIPLAGVLFLGWSVWTILILYWLENGIVGVFNVLKMARAQGPDTADRRAIAQNPVPSGSKLALIPFFVIHYGLFWFVHGIFVLTLPLFTGMFGDSFVVEPDGAPFPDGVPFPTGMEGSLLDFGIAGRGRRSGRDRVRGGGPHDQPRCVVLVELPAWRRVPARLGRRADVRAVRPARRPAPDDHRRGRWR